MLPLLLREVVPPTQLRSGTAVAMPRINFHFLKVMMNSDNAAWGGRGGGSAAEP